MDPRLGPIPAPISPIPLELTYAPPAKDPRRGLWVIAAGLVTTALTLAGVYLLQTQGDNLFSNLAGAGPLTATLGATNVPNQGGLGAVNSVTLEQSNVDLSAQFSNMITLQRAFEANARMVTISDTILEDVVNMKSH